MKYYFLSLAIFILISCGGPGCGDPLDGNVVLNVYDQDTGLPAACALDAEMSNGDLSTDFSISNGFGDDCNEFTENSSIVWGGYIHGEGFTLRVKKEAYEEYTLENIDIGYGESDCFGYSPEYVEFDIYLVPET